MLSLPWIGACWLATDWDQFSSPAKSGAGAPADGGQVHSDAPSGGDAGEGGVVASPNDSGVAPAYGDLVLADRPVGYWPFDEAAGATLVTERITGKSAAPTKASAFTFGAAGVAGNALGSAGKADLPFGDMLDFIGAEPWTVEAWIHPQFESGKVFYEYLNKRDQGNNGLVFYVRHESGGTTVQVEQSYNGGGRGVDRAFTDDGQFHHVVFVYDPGKTGIRCWVDGKHGDKGYDDPGGPTDNPQPLYIASGIKGAIDEMAIYDHALSDDRILAHYHAIRP